MSRLMHFTIGFAGIHTHLVLIATLGSSAISFPNKHYGSQKQRFQITPLHSSHYTPLAYSLHSLLYPLAVLL